MEPMTGYQLLGHFRAEGPNRTTPFLMVTAESKTENVLSARRAGVSSYIVKPFNAALLRTRIEQALSTTEAA
jgi:two-component system chemotaxis response regulator CheY